MDLLHGLYGWLLGKDGLKLSHSAEQGRPPDVRTPVRQTRVIASSIDAHVITRPNPIAWPRRDKNEWWVVWVRLWQPDVKWYPQWRPSHVDRDRAM